MEELKNIKTHLNYVCPHCFNQIEYCTCEYLPRDLISIDYNIQKIIKILNTKGYATKNSCESHSINNNMYIQFWCNYNFITLPKNFKYQKNTLSFWYPKDTQKEDFQDIKKRQLNILLNWCNSLPVRIDKKYF